MCLDTKQYQIPVAIPKVDMQVQQWYGAGHVPKSTDDVREICWSWSVAQMTLGLQRLLIFKVPLVFLGDFQPTHLSLMYQMSLVILLEHLATCIVTDETDDSVVNETSEVVIQCKYHYNSNYTVQLY